MKLNQLLRKKIRMNKINKLYEINSEINEIILELKTKLFLENYDTSNNIKNN